MSARSALRGVSYRSDPYSARLLIVHCLNSLSSPPAAKNILIIRLGAMGDVVRTLPSLRAIRIAYPEAKITWLVERSAAGVLSGIRDLDCVMWFPRESLNARLRSLNFLELISELRDFVAELRRRDFDLVLDFHSILKSGVISFLTRAPCRVTYAPPYGREWGWMFANRRARLELHHTTRFERNAGLVHYLGIRGENPEAQVPGRTLSVEKSAGSRIDALLDDSGEGCARILIHPGSSGHTAHKRYRPEGYTALSRMLRDQAGLSTLVCRGTSGEELALAERIVADSEGAASLAPETPKLDDLIALIDRVRLFVGSDSGPLHIASALGTPVVQIVGPTDPLENQPWPATPWQQVRIPVACSPCRRGCAAATCMKIIPHETIYRQVLKAIESLPERRQRRAATPRLEIPAPVSPACP